MVISLFIFYLDPGKEHRHCHHIVELCLPKSQGIKIGILLVVLQEPLQQVIHSQGAIHVKHDGDIAKEDDNDIKHIPEALEVLQLVLFDLQDLFNGVVDDEDDKDSLTCHHKVVQSCHIAD